MATWTADDIVKVVTALVALVSAIGAVYAAIMAHGAKVKSGENADAIQDVHVSLNSRLTQLLSSTAAQSRAEGRQEGVESRPPRASI